MQKSIRWFAGFFEDQKGSASSKRAILYWAMALITYMVVKSTYGATMNMEVFFGVLGLVVVGLGLATTEFFKSLPIKNNKNGDEV
jgi:hypothetical protein